MTSKNRIALQLWWTKIARPGLAARKHEAGPFLLAGLIFCMIGVLLPLFSFFVPLGMDVAGFLVLDEPFSKAPFQFGVMNEGYAFLAGLVVLHPVMTMVASGLLVGLGLFLFALGKAVKSVLCQIAGVSLVIQASGWLVLLVGALIGVGAVGIFVFWLGRGFVRLCRLPGVLVKRRDEILMENPEALAEAERQHLEKHLPDNGILNRKSRL
jgi:hypothetical protein